MSIYHDWRGLAVKAADKVAELERKVKDLREENLRLRQQRDAANALITFLEEEMKK